MSENTAIWLSLLLASAAIGRITADDISKKLKEGKRLGAAYETIWVLVYFCINIYALIEFIKAVF